MAKTATTNEEKNSVYWCWVRLYANLVYLGRKTMNDVPEKYRDDVAEEVRKREERGY